jgi:addiction module HigA family antidote
MWALNRAGRRGLTSADLFRERNTRAARRIATAIWRVVQRKLKALDVAARLVTADTALRLGRLLKTSPQFWMRLQADWELHQAIRRSTRKAS